MTGPKRDAVTSVATQVTALRTALGWSQGKLAQAMTALGWPWHQSTVARIESGRQPLRVAELPDLAGLFGVPPAALLGDAAEQVSAAALEVLRASLREEVFAELITELAGHPGRAA